MVFIDLKRAYDKVPRKVLWGCLEARGAKTRIKLVGGDLKHFLVEIRFHQGSSLSLFPFSLAMDVLTQNIQDEGSGDIDNDITHRIGTP
ncbi:hypothetical protein H5410_031576 [Solanum commersonii]|uniref:Reverse transcriptase domain-containing protein n=1 Tax=Solanum commersonii TaxID=4109 RepID=A0A9J5YMS3_SOLCO|nr:hypothetical protein H5410_031576 [Solanum commersonii]